MTYRCGLIFLTVQPFLGQILDNSLLMPVHPARDQIYHEVKW